MATIKLPYVRFVRQVSNGTSRSKYSYLAMMRDNAAALESATWAQAKTTQPTLTVNQLTRTDGQASDSGEWIKKPTYTAYLDESYDCFTQAGDANSRMATMCGYAGIVAYRFTLPTVNKGAINNIQLRIQRDRYLRSGVKVVAVMSNSASPSDDWSVIRGAAEGSIASQSEAGEPDGGVESYGFLGQATVSNLLDGRADEGTLEFKIDDFPALSDAANYTYIYIYMSPEDLAGSWQWYNAKDPRAYYIEGSAMLVPVACSFTFATAAEPPDVSHTYELVKGGIVPSFNATEALSPVLQATVQKNGDPIDYNSIKQLAATVVGNGGTVNGTKLEFPSASGERQYAIIYGYGFKGTWPDIPGLVVYDVINRELLYSDTAVGIDTAMSQLLKDGVYGVLDVMYNGRIICPMFYQIGHSDPTPVLDGVVCKINNQGVECFQFNIVDSQIVTSSTSFAYYAVQSLGLGRIYSSVCSWNINAAKPITQNVHVYTKDNKIYNTYYEIGYEWNSPSAPYVGTIKGIVPMPYTNASGENDNVRWKVFVYGDLTSINGVACSHCAIVSLINVSDASSSNPCYISVEVPEIDSDVNWPTLGSNWSVQPQAPTYLNDTFLQADTNSYLICGCSDSKVRRWVTGVWYQTQYDDMLVNGRELPQTGVIGNSTGYGGFFPSTIATESVSIPIEDGAAGLRALYGRFRAFGLTAVPNVTKQIGAAFSVSWKECQLKSNGVKIGSWQIAASALVVPFACPEWDANQIQFDWTGWNGMKTAGAKFHVWLIRDSYNLAPEGLLGASMWGHGTAQGAEYVGEIDPNQVSTTASLPLSHPLAGGYATLIITAYVSMDNVNPSESPTLPKGISTLEVNMADASIVNDDTAFLPDIWLT